MIGNEELPTLTHLWDVYKEKYIRLRDLINGKPFIGANNIELTEDEYEEDEEHKDGKDEKEDEKVVKVNQVKMMKNARLNSRSVRTALTGEMWDTINSAWIELQETWSGGAKTREQLARFLRFVQETSLRFDGSAYRTMLRNDAYWFSRLGLHLERAVSRWGKATPILSHR
eukprot:gene29307-38833_t